MPELENEMNEIMEMLRSKRYQDLRAHLGECNPADIAEALETLIDDEAMTPDELVKVFRLIPKDLAADTFVEMDSDMQEGLIKSFSDKELKEVVEDIYLDDTVDIIEEMPANVVDRILRNVDSATRKSINQILNYPEDSVGSIMTIEYITLRPEFTVRDAFAHIRQVGSDKETINNCYVTSQKKLVGIVSVRDLLLADYDDTIESIMETNVISVMTLDDRETAAQMFNKYDFTAIPVVDKDDRMVGIVTIDDAIDVLTEEATEDIEKMAAITPSEHPYLKASAFETWRQRIPWLLLLMISATFTGIIISNYENALAAQVVLTAFIPMIMDTGGNSGSQASVTVIRSISLGDVDISDILTVIWKEIRVAVLCGATLAAVAFGKIMLVDRLMMGNDDITVLVAAVICLTLLFTVILAKIVGCSLPLIAKRLGFDPAVMASPFITTIVDALSLTIYMKLATMILKL
jgi:magnesium transporter